MYYEDYRNMIIYFIVTEENYLFNVHNCISQTRMKYMDLNGTFLLSSIPKLSLKLCMLCFVFQFFFSCSFFHTHSTHSKRQKHSHNHSIETIQCSWADRINWIILNRKRFSISLTRLRFFYSAFSQNVKKEHDSSVYNFDWRRAVER